MPATPETRDDESATVAPTPGPWRTQGWVPTWAYIPVHDARHNLVCSLYPHSAHGYTRDEVEANASLIAAAPDLLELAKHFRAVADALLGGDTAEACVAECDKVIAKAEGRS